MTKYRVVYEIEVTEPGSEDYAWDAIQEEAYNNPDILNVHFIEQVEIPSGTA